MPQPLSSPEIDAVLGATPPETGGPVRKVGDLELEEALKGTMPQAPAPRPKIVCLCGSMRFADQMDREAVKLTIAGVIVLMPNVDMRRVGDLFGVEIPCDSCFGKPGLITICTKCNHTGRMRGVDKKQAELVKTHLDELHLRKIDMSDEIRFVNAGGYFGESTTRELTYALGIEKPVSFVDKSIPAPVKSIIQAAEYSQNSDGLWMK